MSFLSPLKVISDIREQLEHGKKLYGTGGKNNGKDTITNMEKGRSCSSCQEEIVYFGKMRFVDGKFLCLKCSPEKY